MPDSATMPVEKTAVRLTIPCECAAHCGHVEGRCDHPADVWVIMHDVCGDCREREGGVLSQYLCQSCWEPLSDEIDQRIRLAHTMRMAAVCESCRMQIRCRTDVVHRLIPIRGAGG